MAGEGAGAGRWALTAWCGLGSRAHGAAPSPQRGAATLRLACSFSATPLLLQTTGVFGWMVSALAFYIGAAVLFQEMYNKVSWFSNASELVVFRACPCAASWPLTPRPSPPPLQPRRTPNRARRRRLRLSLPPSPQEILPLFPLDWEKIRGRRRYGATGTRKDLAPKVRGAGPAWGWHGAERVIGGEGHAAYPGGSNPAAAHSRKRQQHAPRWPAVWGWPAARRMVGLLWRAAQRCA